MKSNLVVLSFVVTSANLSIGSKLYSVQQTYAMIVSITEKQSKSEY